MMDVGIDVGGTNLRAGVVDEQGKLLSRVSQSVGTLKSPEELIRRLAELAQKAVEDAGTPENQIQSVGVGIPGAVSEGNILYTCNLPLRDVPFEQLFRRFFDRPVYLENDANCAAAGEWLYGAGRGRKNFVMVTLGTGLGGGFILNGKLYGGGGMAGEIGHMVIRRDGPAVRLRPPGLLGSLLLRHGADPADTGDHGRAPGEPAALPWRQKRALWMAARLFRQRNGAIRQRWRCAGLMRRIWQPV